MTDTGDTRCGFVAILGAPNVGKSTLLNRLVGAKVSIVSPKVQTTRTRVLGICIEGDAQVIFIDTPGIFAPKRRLDRAMVASAWGGAADADETLLLIDASRGIDGDTRNIIDGLKKQAGDKPNIVLAINKVDLVKKEALLKLIADLTETGLFREIFMISAQTGDGVPEMMTYLAGGVRKGPWLYPEDQMSDMPSRLLAAEITREQLYRQLHQELPYAATVETEEWEQREDGSITIRQIIYIERPSQKGIVLGKGGQKIKSLGAASRKELESMFECRVHLFLFVKVREKWGDDPDRYRDWGLDYNA
ncbi:MAG: GTPase Era [Rhodospirillaceae bacterium]|jgi:GTPase|nr:GTPase Era [Rhodospirillaceae bacterium]MBT4219353.1 GTPase Era [Rhodospirillaceae bacterium]MBT4463448.1 GTPase Era [Rhodospirillaceae bacterium]MBT5308132.1 GTPase Era [Rhodospirillaceae bacterium]MBT7355676.1 GTPase Era [Rhodospirillaceae bacterium]